LSLNDVDSIYRYIIPLGSALLGSLGPLGVFIWIDKYNSLQAKEDIDYKLFNALRNFSHGEWAASNLNSLQLLFENLSVEDLNDDEYLRPFNKRKTTFFELTLPIIKEIISLSSRILDTKEASKEIKKHLNIITDNLSKDINQATISNKNDISKSIVKLRDNISFLKNIIFVNHSCSPLKVYNNISENIQKITEKDTVDLTFKTFLEEKDFALMDAASLADIIDNCVGNSMKAMDKVANKRLVIKLIKDDLRYFISISDNGCGIDIDKQELIFENGYSTTSSTGFGLFYAKETLSKYGGRIYVRSSKPWVKTTFIIELQKNTNKNK
jgi:signal transduction histidine kinase